MQDSRLLLTDSRVVELHHKTRVVLWSILGSIAGVWAYALVVAAISGPSAGPYSVRGGLLGTFGRDPAWWSSAILVLGALILMEMASGALLQNHALRAWLLRCWSSSVSASKRRGGGVREGFDAWEPRLWQEMEKDTGVKLAVDRLWREECGDLRDQRSVVQGN